MANCLGKILEVGIHEDEVIRKGVFNQQRGIGRVAKDMPGLMDQLSGLPTGTVVLDLGCGKGVTLGSATHPLETRVLGTETEPPWGPLAEKLAHLQFVGVTATRAEMLLVPAQSPSGRYAILSGRLFEEIQTQELTQIYGKRFGAAYDDYGIFAYTSTPGKDLTKLHQVLLPGAQVRMVWRPDLSNHGVVFQIPTGQVISFEDFIRLYARESFEVRTEPNQLVLTAHGEVPRFPQLELVHVEGDAPGKRFFRVVDPSLSPQRILQNELQLWVELDPLGHYAGHLRVDFTSPVQVFDGAFLKKIEEPYLPFSKSTVLALDPYFYQKALTSRVLVGDTAELSRFLVQHPEALRTGQPWDFLFEALVDLKQGKTTSPALDKIKPYLRHVGQDSARLREDALLERSPFAFSIQSIVDALFSKRPKDSEFLLVNALDHPYPSSDPRAWQRQINLSAETFAQGDTPLAFSHYRAADRIQSVSAAEAIEALRLVWHRLPEARAWMQRVFPRH
jgi:hypothetical protein